MLQVGMAAEVFEIVVRRIRFVDTESFDRSALPTYLEDLWASAETPVRNGGHLEHQGFAAHTI